MRWQSVQERWWRRLSLGLVLSARKRPICEPTGHVAGIVNQNEETSPLDSTEAEEDPRVGLDEVDEEAEGHVRDHKKPEGVAGAEAAWVPIAGRILRDSRNVARERRVLRLRITFARDNTLTEDAVKERNQ